jgi:cytochrome c biogenesis protein
MQAQIAIDDEDGGLVAAEHVFQRAGLRPERMVRESSFSLFGERNRISEMAVYIVHASLLLIFLGGIVDALYGWRGFVAIASGEQTSQLGLQSGAVRTLPFAIRCDAAGQDNYADGTPKKWWSKLAVLEGGRVVMRKEIVVNDPLVYRGVRFYQSSFGNTGKVDKIVFTVTPASGQSESKQIALAGDEILALDADTTVRIADFIPDYVVRDGQVYTRSAQVENPAVHLVVESKKLGKAVNVWLPPIPGFEQNSSSPYKFDATDLQMVHFTGLQVSHEPGQWVVWAGVMVMGFGLVVVFYLVHVRFWAVPVRDTRGRLLLWVGGTANKNKDVFEQRFRKLVQAIETEVKVQSEQYVPADAVSLAGD